VAAPPTTKGSAPEPRPSRRGPFFPAQLERRRRVDKALFAVVMAAFVGGVLTRKFDDAPHRHDFLHDTFYCDD